MDGLQTYLLSEIALNSFLKFSYRHSHIKERKKDRLCTLKKVSSHAGYLRKTLLEKKQERQDLPVFRVFERDNRIFVSLKGRKELPLDVFILDFVSGRIKFCKTLKPLPKVEVIFIEFPCYRCGSLNHIYFLSPFKSACNVEISEMEAEEMWSDSKFSFDKRIVVKVQSYAKSRGKDNINLACIKRRYSNTAGDEYLSFGCNDCDALFGDFFVREAIIESYYGDEVVEKVTFETDAVEEFRQNIPHWCHPGENDFCE